MTRIKAARDALVAVKKKFAEATDPDSFNYNDYCRMSPEELLQTLLSEIEQLLADKYEVVSSNYSNTVEKDIRRLEATRDHLKESFSSLLFS